MKKERLDYLDFAKCIAILLVIWGHTTSVGSTVAYKVALYSFHMPLFFLVSGMVISRHRRDYDRAHWKCFISKNIMTLLVPYLIWGTFYSEFNFVNFAKLFYGSWEMLNAAKTLTSLWYLPCLFVARIMAEFVLMMSWKVKRIPRHLFGFIIAVLSFAIGFLLPKISIGYPLCCDIAFIALGFIMLGYAVKTLVYKLPRTHAWPYLAATAVFGAMMYIGQKIQGDSPYLMLMCRSDYGQPIYFFLCAFAGIGTVMAFSVFLTILFKDRPDTKARRFMLWAGENTIGIYFLHKPFLQQVIMPVIASLGAVLPNAWWALLGSVFSFAVSSLVCCIINRYVPSLFGRFPSVTKPAE